MPVRIADQQSRPIIAERLDSGRDETDTGCGKPVLQGWHITDLEYKPRRSDVITAQRCRCTSRAVGKSIAEQFEMRVSRPGIERRHLDDCARDGIKLFLFPATVERAPDNGKSQDLPIKRNA